MSLQDGDVQNIETEDFKGRRIQPILFNTASDGSGTFKFPVSNAQDRLITASKPYVLDIAEGNIADHERFDVSGSNPNLQDSWENIWHYGGLYTYPTSAAAVYISSSNAGDNQVWNVRGLDANWDFQSLTVTANGQSQVRVGTTETFIRVFGTYNMGTTDSAGDVYIAFQDTLTGGVPDTASKVLAVSPAGRNASSTGTWTVPNGHKAYILDAFASNGSLKTVRFRFRYRQYGGVFITVRNIILYQGNIDSHISIPHSLPAKTDIDFIGISSAVGGAVNFGLTGWYEDV